MTMPTTPRSPSDDPLRARLLAQIAAEPSPPRATHRLRGIVVAVASTAAIVSVLLLAGIHLEPRPPELVLGTLVGAVALAALGIWLALGLGRSMLGRPGRWIVVGLFAVPVLLFVWKTMWSALYPDMDLWVSARPGFRCLGWSLLGALGPVTGLIWFRRKTIPRHPGLLGAALGMAAGASSWALLDLYCPIGNPGHLLLGHVLPMVLLGVAGFFVGRTVFRPRDLA